LAALVCAGFGLSLAPESQVLAQATPALPTVRVATQAFDDMTAMLYAQRMGWFQRAGLDVQVERQTTSGAAIGAAILGGTFDIGKMGLSDVIQAHEKGIPFVVVAPAGIYNSALPTTGLLVLKNGPIFTGKDLNGKIVAQTSLGDIGSVTLDAWMDQNGGDWRSIRYVEVPMSAIPAAIEAGRVDAGGSLEPVLAQTLASGKFRLITTYSAVAPKFVYAVWVTTRDWADKHRATVKTLAAVLAQSAAYTNAHHAETAAMISDFSAIPLARIESMPRIEIGTTLRASQIQPVIEAAVRDHTIAHSFPAAEILDADAMMK
jgi:NitT/TauT family transport system substrate-binding protein